MPPEQIEVLTLAAHGYTTSETAERLGLNAWVVRHRLGQALHTLGAGSKLEAVLTAYRRGLLPPPGPTALR